MFEVKFPVGKVAFPIESKTIIWLVPESIVYVTVALGVPLKDIKVEAPEQIGVVPEIVAIGNAVTVIGADPDCYWEQEVTESETLTSI